METVGINFSTTNSADPAVGDSLETEAQNEIQAASWNTSSTMNKTIYSFITSSNTPHYHICHLSHTLICRESPPPCIIPKMRDYKHGSEVWTVRGGYALHR